MMDANVLFLCTGNTCRSVMAEALASNMYPNIKVASAGVMVKTPQPPSQLTIDVMQEIDIDVSSLRSTFIVNSELDKVDNIYAMESFQLVLFDQMPLKYAGETCLLSLDSNDISDPVGYGIDVYRKTRDIIKECLIKRFGDK